ncbi:hypothetical protein E2C01_001086 [Portunus trituberculatus]|uniref:Uncharacterized protein n=1 Tax=Portunus trituberculatus TaxID=210409 RepID=A0A5B7CG16_PORTR|nr:hypothetical protein [Portunus trituberculatus]
MTGCLWVSQSTYQVFEMLNSSLFKNYEDAIRSHFRRQSTHSPSSNPSSLPWSLSSQPTYTLGTQILSS